MRRFVALWICVAACSPAPRAELTTASEALVAPVAAYGFEEGSGSTTADSSGNGLTGTLTATTWTSSGKFGKALSFNGSSSWVTVPDANALDLTIGMTVMAWVKPTTLSGWTELVYKERPGGFSYALYANAGTNQPNVSYGISDGTERNLSAGTMLPMGSWTHVAGT